MRTEKTTRLINSPEQHKKYLSEVEKLIELDPPRGTPEAERLSLLSLAIDEYEKDVFHFRKPTAVEAIKFRMDEQGLKQNDLVPYFGSKSKVSEVLAGKRKLSLAMVRALHKHLGIPVEVLLSEDEEDGSIAPLTASENIEWDQFPFGEMQKRKWIAALGADIKSSPKRVFESFLRPIGGLAPQSAFWRRSLHRRGEQSVGQHSLIAWAARVLILAKDQEVGAFEQKFITLDFLREVAKLSHFEKGPLLVTEYLNKYGIKIVFEKHLPNTKLDGGCLLDSKGHPVIGMTLRYDRIDYFWHTLMHEIVHVQKHLRGEEEVFLDDLEFEDSLDQKEREADRIAGEAFIPRNIWKRSDAFNLQTVEAVNELARELSIHPAIIAGKIRFETKNYSKFSDLIGQGQIRKLFWAEGS